MIGALWVVLAVTLALVAIACLFRPGLFIVYLEALSGLALVAGLIFFVYTLTSIAARG